MIIVDKDLQPLADLVELARNNVHIFNNQLENETVKQLGNELVKASEARIYRLLLRELGMDEQYKDLLQHITEEFLRTKKPITNFKRDKVDPEKYLAYVQKECLHYAAARFKEESNKENKII